MAQNYYQATKQGYKNIKDTYTQQKDGSLSMNSLFYSYLHFNIKVEPKSSPKGSLPHNTNFLMTFLTQSLEILEKGKRLLLGSPAYIFDEYLSLFLS